MQDKDKAPKAIEKEAEPGRAARREEPVSGQAEQSEPLDEDSLDHVLRHTPL